MKKAVSVVIVLALSLASASTVYASTIRFEGVAPAGVQFAVGNHYVEAGFDFFNPGLPTDAAIIGQPSQNVSGSAYYTWNSPAANNPVVLSQVGGGFFDFLGLDVGSKGGASVTGSSNFSITGFLSGGGTVSFNVVGADLFAPLALNWASLSKVEFAFGSGDFGAIDNLVVTQATVPEPATMILLGSGLLGIARRARRRSRQ